MMEKKVKCHICGKENIRKYWIENVGVVEDYYFCDRCGYFWEMAYGPVFEGIFILKFPHCFKQFFILIKSIKKTKGLRLSRPCF